MRTTLKTLTALCAGTLLLACAEPGKQAPAAPAIPQAAPSADAAYQQGRQQQLGGDLTAAVASYRRALQADPSHLNARNGLATIYAEQGDLAQAITIWQALTAGAASASGPAMGYLFSNLGYAYFLNGDYQNALLALERACVLDPLNHRAWQHLGRALETLGQDERARLMYKQASALQAHDFKADYAVAQRAGVAAIDSAVVAERPNLPAMAETEVRLGASGMFELRRTTPGAVAAAAAPAAPAILPAPAAVALLQDAAPEFRALLEIRNGNGVTGMARSLARKMGGGSLRVVRLTNQKGFGVQRTRVEYQPAFRQAAQQLAERFGSASVVEVEDCKSTDLRLVIGRDLIRARHARPAARAVLAARAPAKTS
jgi:Flp pilus assembly protein TadD